MLKTIKVKKQLRLDELVKYIREEQVGDGNYREYLSDCQKYKVRASGYKLDYVSKFNFINPNMPLNTTFTIELEEEITKDTKFTWLVEASDERIWNQKNASISDVIDERTNEIRALINGKLELIWGSKSDERN